MTSPTTRRAFLQTSATALAAGLLPSHLLAQIHPPAPHLRFGVNYTPRRKWWYCWQDWDQQSILDDLHGIAALGVDHIRIQCLWPIFQPGIASINQRAVANLHLLLEAAATVGLDVEVTVLNGWMSGLSFLPAWVAPLAEHDRNIFTSAAVIDAEKLLFRTLAAAIGNHPRFLGFDIGNELGVLQRPGNNPATPAQADAWAADLLRCCDQIAPGKFHVNGVDHSHWFNDVGFTRSQLATTGHASIVHSYIYFTGVLQRYKYSDPSSLHLAAYMVELAYAYQTDLTRRVWVEETGVGNKEMPESYKPEFMQHSIHNVAATGKAWGVTWWCSHDIDPAIKDFSDYEYGLGLLDLNNRPKPMGLKLASLISEFQRTPPQPAPRTSALVIPDRGLSAEPWPPDWTYATPYMQLIAKGKLPAIVLESRAHDTAYLQARGITELIPLSSVSRT